MSDPRILLLGPAHSVEESSQRLEMLRGLEIANAVKIVVATGKFDTGRDVKTFKVDANHPPEPAYLQSLSAWAELPYSSEPRFRDSYDLFCLRTLLTQDGDFDYAVLLRDAVGFQEGWSALLAEVKDRMFSAFHDGSTAAGDPRKRQNLIINLRADRSREFIDLAWQLYINGAVYAIASYSLEKSLGMAEEGLRLAREAYQS